MSLRAVVCQQLIPTKGGAGRVPAVELLLATYAVRNHIRKGNVDRLYNELTAGRGRGMQTMEHALTELVTSGAITPEQAQARTSRPDELGRMLG